MKVARRTGELTAASLKDRCTLKKPTLTSDGRGGYVTTYTSQEVWCMAIPRANSRSTDQAQIIYDDIIDFYIRYGVPFDASYVVEFKGAEYVVQNVNDINNRYQYYKFEGVSKKL